MKHEIKTQHPSSCSAVVFLSTRPLCTTHPLVFGSDDELLVLLGHHAAGAVGGLQHVDDQVIGQHIQLLHIVSCHVHRARQALPVWTNQSAAHTHKSLIGDIDSYHCEDVCSHL